MAPKKDNPEGWKAEVVGQSKGLNGGNQMAATTCELIHSREDKNGTSTKAGRLNAVGQETRRRLSVNQ